MASEAVVNYVALLGWSPKDGSEKLGIDELVARFDLANVNRKGAHFDLEKCNWLKAQCLIQMPMARYVALAKPGRSGQSKIHDCALSVIKRAGVRQYWGHSQRLTNVHRPRHRASDVQQFHAIER